MSGTSMDGLDCGLFHISLTHDYRLEWKCQYFKIIPYSHQTRCLIIKALAGNKKAILEAHIELSQIFTSSVKAILKKSKVDIIASHGQTIAHEDGISTYQIGNHKDMHQVFQIPVVYNVRQADIDVGGNGAPLMPFLDWLLFKESRENTITLNLGGIANISFIPSSGNRNEVIGFDTGPGMCLMDETCREVWNINMDQDGSITALGNVNAELLNELMQYKFITQKPPKSTGRDKFGSNMVKKIIKENPHIPAEDLMRTFCAFTAKSIGYNLKNILNFNRLKPQLFISGGGVHHPVLMDDIRKYVQITNIKTTDGYGIDPKIKESLLMAVLAVARKKNLPSNMPSVSGANRHTVLGDIFIADQV